MTRQYAAPDGPDRGRDEWQPELTINPGVQFGAVCIPGTRVPAYALSDCVIAGDTIDQTAEGYGVDRRDVLLACWWRWDHHFHRPASRQSGPGKRIVAAWTEWGYTAFDVFAGWKHDPIPDPPPVP